MRGRVAFVTAVRGLRARAPSVEGRAAAPGSRVGAQARRGPALSLSLETSAWFLVAPGPYRLAISSVRPRRLDRMGRASQPPRRRTPLAEAPRSLRAQQDSPTKTSTTRSGSVPAAD